MGHGQGVSEMAVVLPLRSTLPRRREARARVGGLEDVFRCEAWGYSVKLFRPSRPEEALPVLEASIWLCADACFSTTCLGPTKILSSLLNQVLRAASTILGGTTKRSTPDGWPFVVSRTKTLC